MNLEELQMRLQNLGADIPESTLRRWAAEGLIANSIRYTKPRKKKWGRPYKGKDKEAQPGLFSYWPEESLQEAAATWAVRNLPRPAALSPDARALVFKKDLGITKKDRVTREKLMSVEQKRRTSVAINTLLPVKEAAKSLRTLLYADCKKAANRFRTYLWPGAFSSKEIVESKILNFDERSTYPLMLIYVQAIEKARHQISLDTSINITYDWVIREDGLSAWKGMHIEKTYSLQSKVILNVTHLRPCDNGYSNDYGFPNDKEFRRDGFVDCFSLTGSQLTESFDSTRFGPVPPGYYDQEEYVDYLDKDPYGWADYAAEFPQDDD